MCSDTKDILPDISRDPVVLHVSSEHRIISNAMKTVITGNIADLMRNSLYWRINMLTVNGLHAETTPHARNHVREMTVGELVTGTASVFHLFNDTGASENLKLLADYRLWIVKQARQFHDPEIILAKGVNDTDTYRVTEAFEDLGGIFEFLRIGIFYEIHTFSFF